MALHFVALIFSVCSFVLLLIANLGTTFDSTFLPNIHLVQINQAINNRHIRYGVYNSCLYYPDSKTAHSCTKKLPTYPFDALQFADACGADLTNATQVSVFKDVVSDAKLTTFKGIVLIMPAVVFSFIALACTLLIRRIRRNNIIPFIGTFVSLFSFLTGAAGLALVIVTFWKGLATLERRVEGLSHQWGPAIYLVGIGSGCILITLVCFVISLFSYSSESHQKETFHLYDYDLNQTDGGDHYGTAANNPYDTTTHLNSPKIDSNGYNDYHHAVSTPSGQYPSYNQQTYQQPQHQYQQTNYHQSSGNYY